MPGSSKLRSLLHAIVLVGIAALLVAAIGGDRGRLNLLRAEATRDELLESIAELEAENRDLALLVRQLHSPGFAREKVARETFGLVRPDEIVFVDAAPPASAAAPTGAGPD